MTDWTKQKSTLWILFLFENSTTLNLVIYLHEDKHNRHERKEDRHEHNQDRHEHREDQQHKGNQHRLMGRWRQGWRRQPLRRHASFWPHLKKIENEKIKCGKGVSDLKARLDCCEDPAWNCGNLNFCFPTKTEPFYWLRSQCRYYSRPKVI